MISRNFIPFLLFNSIYIALFDIFDIFALRLPIVSNPTKINVLNDVSSRTKSVRYLDLIVVIGSENPIVNTVIAFN